MDQAELVLVLDFGGQYNQLIARRVREYGVYCEMLSYRTPLAEILARHPAGIIFSGGPASVYGQGAPRLDPEIFAAGVPILGICYGMQLMAYLLGGKVEPGPEREYGRAVVQITREDALLRGLPRQMPVWMSHGDRVIAAPPGFKVTAQTARTPVAALAHQEKKLYGVQFHPEVKHTPQGADILRHFLYDICGCRGGWNMGSFVAQEIERIGRQVGAGRALCALSGGVDSSVAAVLVHRAIGDRLTCIFVDHGLLRRGEAEQVVRTFKDRLHIPLRAIDARERFLKRLEGVADPEAKRKIIGEEFIRVFEEEAGKIGQVEFLVQGTLYPDVIESGTDTAATIKSHHNVGGLPEKMQLTLIEPLRLLFKDEVRNLGLELGLPEEIVWRQPFPGPGLAVRVTGAITKEKLEIVRAADAIIQEELHRVGLDRELWQSFAVLPDMRSVGVMGDERTYTYAIVLRAVTSEDAMTADWARLPYEVLERISSRVTNEVKHVNRVLYDITSKPPATIEWE